MKNTEATNIDGASVLVVGGAGFVGSHVVQRCLAGGAASVTVVDNLLSSERSNLPMDDRLAFIEGSIADDEVLEQVGDRHDFVFHLNTFHGNESSIARPLEDHEHNLLPTLKLYVSLKDSSRLRRLVYSSTGCALAARGEVEPVGVQEDGPVPLDYDSPYQISKVVGEMYGLYFHARHGLPFVRARFQNVFGPGEILGAGRWRGHPATVWRNVVPTFIYRALNDMPLKVHGDGTAARDFVFVRDVVEGLMKLATLPGLEGDVFNLASGQQVRILDLANQIVELTGSTSPISLTKPRSWDTSLQRFGATEKATARLGFQATTDLQTALMETISWTRANLGLIDECIQRHAKHMAAY